MTNAKPNIYGTDDGIWRRLKMIPFQRKFEDGQKDTSLTDKLKAEASGILNEALAGLKAYLASGLGEPEAVKAATKEYREAEDVIGRFLADTVEFAQDGPC